MSLEERYRHASAETQRLVDELLAADADDRAWAEQLGVAYRQGEVARLLGKSKQAVSADRGLLRLRMRSGDIGYPAFQFVGPRVLGGVREVVAVLSPVVATPWTTASWLTSPHVDLEGRRPLEVLRDGCVDEVLAAARRTARALAG